MEIENVRKIKNELKKVKPKSKAKNTGHKLNLKGIIFELAPELDKMKANGYCYAEIVETLKQHNVLIGVQTLSKYLSDFRKKTAPAAVEKQTVMVVKKTRQQQTEVEPIPYYTETEYEQDYNAADVNDWDDYKV